MILYNHQLMQEELNIRKVRSHHKKQEGKSNSKYYCDDIFTLDIETTSAWLKNGKPIGYTKGYNNEYWNTLQPLALPYIWPVSYTHLRAHET